MATIVLGDGRAGTLFATDYVPNSGDFLYGAGESGKELSGSVQWLRDVMVAFEALDTAAGECLSFKDA